MTKVSIIFTTLLFFAAAYSYTAPEDAIHSLIRTTCGCTIYPKLCYTPLTSRLSTTKSQWDQYIQKPYLLAGVAVNVSLSDAKNAFDYIHDLYSNHTYTNKTTISILKQCVGNLKDTVGQIKASLDQMGSLTYHSDCQEFKLKVSNVRTWLSAAMTDDDTCADELANLEKKIKSKVGNKISELENLISNALALVKYYYDPLGN